MFWEDKVRYSDQLITITRNSKGKIIKRTDSNHKSVSKHFRNLVVYALTGKKAHNTMCTAGFAIAAKLIAGIAATPFTYICIGTGVTGSAAGDTDMQTSVLKKSVTPTVTTTTVTGDTTVWDYVFGQSGDGLNTIYAITEVGIMNAASGVTMLAHFASATVLATFTPNTGGTGDTFEAIVKIKQEQGA
jgi:hypothetical protein